jgi:hypothetical protein
MQAGRWAKALTLGVLLLTVGACERETPTPAEREAITAVVRPFLIQLAAAYTTQDPAKLAGLAAPRMIESVRHGIELMQAGGRRLEPVLIKVEITSMKVLRHSNAILACTETWDTRSFDAYTGQLLGRNENSVLHSHIQLKLVKGTWVVLDREVDETTTGPRLMLPTPTPR